MLNWKVCVGASLLMIAGVQFLKIKDFYNPDRITTLVGTLIITFMITFCISIILLVNGLIREKRGSRR